MANLVVREIPENQYKLLRSDARRNRRSLNAELLAMIAERAELARRRREAGKAMRRLDKLRVEISRKYPNAPESVELIRELRDSR